MAAIPVASGSAVKAISVADDVADGTRSARFIPSPNGKKGGLAHQDLVRQVADDIRSRGLKPQEEYRILTPGGRKNSRFVDVVGINSNDEVVEMHQIGKMTKSGLPVSRERRAIEDIDMFRPRASTNTQFHPYN